MKSATKTENRNFHLPVQPDLYDALLAEARRAGRPATEVAREALRYWIEMRRRLETERFLQAYIDAVAGTPQDLDPELEAAGLESLRGRPRRRRARR